MKIFILFLLISGEIANSYGQMSNATYKVVPIITKQAFYLNGGAKAMFGGVSREALQVNLPSNTVEWYYTITTSPNKNQPSNGDLTGQLVKLLVPDIGIATTALSSILVPSGSGACDIYLMTNANEVNKYVNKQPAGSAIMNDSRINFISGIVQVKDFLNGQCFLVMRNPSASQGLNITIEVSAIVRSTKNRSTTM
jgi:hypothetical protein